MQSIKRVLVGVAALAAIAFGAAQIAGAAGGGTNEQSDDQDAPLTGATAQKAKAAALKATGGGTIESAEASDEDGSAYEVKVDKDSKILEVQVDDAFDVTSTKADDDQAESADEADEAGDGDGDHGDGDGDGGDEAVTGADAAKARAAAVDAVGGGMAREVRTENEGDAVYEVEVSFSDKTYDVKLDDAFAVVDKQVDEGDGDGETHD